MMRRGTAFSSTPKSVRLQVQPIPRMARNKTTVGRIFEFNTSSSRFQQKTPDRLISLISLGISRFYPQPDLGQTTLRTELQESSPYCGRSSGSPSPPATFPSPIARTVVQQCQKGSLFQGEKGEVTAAGPLPNCTGFPIKSRRTPWSLSIRKEIVLSTGKTDRDMQEVCMFGRIHLIFKRILPARPDLRP